MTAFPSPEVYDASGGDPGWTSLGVQRQGLCVCTRARISAHPPGARIAGAPERIQSRYPPLEAPPMTLLRRLAVAVSLPALAVFWVLGVGTASPVAAGDPPADPTKPAPGMGDPVPP